MVVVILEKLLFLTSFAIFAICLIAFIVEKKRYSNETNCSMNEMYKRMFLNSKSKGLFDFELIQKREDLLKKNSGPNLCKKCPKIKYVEYCDTVKFDE